MENTNQSVISENSQISEPERKKFDFYQALFEQTKKSKNGRNFIMSPVSLYFALGIVAECLNQEEQEKIVEKLGLAPDSIFIEDKATMMINWLNQKRGESQLKCCNSLWVAEDLPIYDAFKDKIEAKYKAEINNVDFANPSTTTEMN